MVHDLRVQFIMEESMVVGAAFCCDIDGHIVSTSRKQTEMMLTVYHSQEA